MWQQTWQRACESTHEQKEALAWYMLSAVIVAYADRRIRNKEWSGSDTQLTYVALLVVLAVVRWLKKLTPIGN